MTDDLSPDPPGGPARDFDPAEQKFLDRMRGKAELIRADRIRDMNADRPKPQLLTDYTPSGPVVEEVHTPEAERKNTEIDRDIENFNNSIGSMKDVARDDFEKSR